MNKLKIAHSFSRAAGTYDKAAHLQREVGEHLLELLPPTQAMRSIIDLGCGTGFFTHKLAIQFPDAVVYGVDIAEGMLDFANNRYNNKIHWICADAENLPFGDNSADIIFSSLAMQWCENTYQFLSEVKRVLKPGGTALLSTFGNSTLQELRCSWQQVDYQAHVNHFLSVDELKNHIEQVYFSSSSVLHYVKTLMYSSPVELMRELKNLGAHEVADRNVSGLMGKSHFQLFLQAYQKMTNGNLFPATYEVIYIHLTK